MPPSRYSGGINKIRMPYMPCSLETGLLNIQDHDVAADHIGDLLGTRNVGWRRHEGILSSGGMGIERGRYSS